VVARGGRGQADDDALGLPSLYMRPHSDKAVADWESFFATTSFVVK